MMPEPMHDAARHDRGFLGGGRDPGDFPDGPDEPKGLTCEFAGHTWQDAGGGLEICALCEAERWADA